MGMRGTGSNDISVTDVYVPRSKTFPFVPDFEPGSHYRGPLYRLPVVGVAATGIPTPMLGVARRAGVAFHQRARHVVGGQEDGAGQPGQPASDNQHRRLRRRHRVPLSAAHRVVRANVRLS
jgi:hypothetical protein